MLIMRAYKPKNQLKYSLRLSAFFFHQYSHGIITKIKKKYSAVANIDPHLNNLVWTFFLISIFLIEKVLPFTELKQASSSQKTT